MKNNSFKWIVPIILQILSISVLICGYEAAYFYKRSEKEYLSKKSYEVSNDLKYFLGEIQKTYLMTLEVLQDSNINSISNQEKGISVDFNKEYKLIESLPNVNQPEAYEKLATSLLKNSDNLKVLHKELFDKSIRILHDNLLNYASKLKIELGIGRIEGNKYNQNQYNIYQEGLNSRENRFQIANKLRDQLLLLKKDCTRSETIIASKQAIEGVDKILSLIGAPNQCSLDNFAAKTDTNSPPSQLPSELLAIQLRTNQWLVDDLFYSGWKLDSQLNRLIYLCKAEKLIRDNKMNEVNAVIIKINYTYYFILGVTFLISIGISLFATMLFIITRQLERIILHYEN